MATGGNAATLTFAASVAWNSYEYRCLLQNGCGSPAVTDTSAVATLLVCAPAKVFSQPGNASVNVGATATFSVSGSGSAPLSYQWLRGNGAAWLPVTTGTGGTTNTYQLVTAGTDNGAQFRVVVTNGCGKDSSGAVTLTVCTPPVITAQPADVNSNPGVADTFTAGATGTSIAYQWQRSDSLGQVWNQIPNATAAVYVITPAITDNGAEFRCSIASQCGDTMTRVAKLTVCVPVKVTQQNIGPDSVLVGQAVRFAMSAQGTNVAFQWQRSGDGTTFTNIPGDTADTISFFAAIADSGTTFRCMVTGKCGAAVTGNPGLVRVFTPVHALFGVSPAAGIVPLTASFTDSSTGSFTKRVWDFGDGSEDSVITANKSLSHNFTVAKNYTVRLVVSGPGGSDTAWKSVFVYVPGADPIQMSGSYVSSQKVSAVFSNFDTIITPSPQVTVDSVGVWYRTGAYPQTPAAPSTYLRSYTLAALKSRGTSTYTDTLAVPALAATDSLYGFMNGIFWSDGKISAFDSGNGTLVLMRDTFPIINNLQLSGRYAPDDTALVFLGNANKTDTSRVDSVLLWYSLTGDTNPNFKDTNFTLRLTAKAVARAGAGDTIPIVNALFNNEQRTIAVAVVLVGHNTKQSDVKKYKFVVGKLRPINPIHLRAQAVSSNSIRLTWKSVAGSGVERIMVWYRAGSPIPLQYDFTSLKLDSLSPSVADTTITSSKFNPQTRYYFGAQVYANGLWSYVTDSSSASDSTWATGAPLSKNNTAITSLVFDPSVNQIRVCWKLDSTVLANGDSLPQLAIVYSTDSFATSVGASPQVVDTGATSCAYVKLREDLVFNATYYVSLWLRASNSAWTAPSTPQGRQSVVVPMYKWQSVLLFSKDYDTVYAFNRQLRFTNQPGDVSRVPDTVVVDSIHPYGFTPVSIAFEFTVKAAGWPFNVGMKLAPIPAGYTANDVRIFRLMPNGEWMEDTLPVYVDSAGGYVYELTNQLAMPFVAGIDMRRPSARILTNLTDPVPAGVAIIDTFLLSDNIANLRWRFMSTKGGEAFSTGDTTQSGILSDTSARVAVTTPGTLVSRDNGVRGMIIVTDGTYRDTVTISRRVVRDTSDLVWTENGKWVPMSVTVDLDTPSATTAFLPLSGTPWKYDNTKFRVFRWGATAADKWVEYADTISKAFNFVRGSQMWVKAKNKTPIRFGRGVTPSLDSSFMVTLPSKQWVDLALPFNFDITVADIIGATKDSVKTGDTLGIDSVLIFDWTKDTTGHFRTELIFNNTIISPQLNNAAQPLSSSDPAGFTFYNNGGSAVQLVIPPVPQAMSTRLAKKAALKQQQGWAIEITSKLGDGSVMSPVYCGYRRRRRRSRRTIPCLLHSATRAWAYLT